MLIPLNPSLPYTRDEFKAMAIAKSHIKLSNFEPIFPTSDQDGNSVPFFSQLWEDPTHKLWRLVMGNEYVDNKLANRHPVAGRIGVLDTISGKYDMYLSCVHMRGWTLVWVEFKKGPQCFADLSNWRDLFNLRETWMRVFDMLFWPNSQYVDVIDYIRQMSGQAVPPSRQALEAALEFTQVPPNVGRDFIPVNLRQPELNLRAVTIDGQHASLYVVPGSYGTPLTGYGFLAHTRRPRYDLDRHGNVIQPGGGIAAHVACVPNWWKGMGSVQLYSSVIGTFEATTLKQTTTDSQPTTTKVTMIVRKPQGFARQVCLPRYALGTDNSATPSSRRAAAGIDGRSTSLICSTWEIEKMLIQEASLLH